MADKRVLVTGGTGFIGSNVVKVLQNQGYVPRVLLRKTSDTSRIKEINYESTFGDILDPPTIAKALEGCSYAIHCAGPSSWDELENDTFVQRLTIEGTRNIVEEAKKKNIKKFVYFSSATAINGSKKKKVFDEESDYTIEKYHLGNSLAKRGAEDVVIQASNEGLNVVIINPGEVYGENDNDLITAYSLVDALKQKPFVIVPIGGTGVVYVEDVAKAAVSALEKGKNGQRYILSAENFTCKKIAEYCLEIADKKRPVIQVPGFLLVFLAKLTRAFGLRLYSPEMLRYASFYWYFDSKKARNELEINFLDGYSTLTRTVKWLKKKKLV
jgi:dihydroflavonol-4-reductase